MGVIGYARVSPAEGCQILDRRLRPDTLAASMLAWRHPRIRYAVCVIGPLQNLVQVTENQLDSR